jgi:hypothetical protein
MKWEAAIYRHDMRRVMAVWLVATLAISVLDLIMVSPHSEQVNKPHSGPQPHSLVRPSKP